MEQLLHMMDIKEDPELQSLAYHVFRHLPNIPHRPGDESRALVDSLVRIGRASPSWHQRLRVLINIQVLYFRNLFLMQPQEAVDLFLCVREMLHDAQLEVRLGAAATLSGMIRCSPNPLRDRRIKSLKNHFTGLLIDNPLPSKRATKSATKSAAATVVDRDSGASTPTPEQNKLTLTRHAAVLGLSALVQAFPYTSPPPAWLPEVLTTLASRAASDTGSVGKSVKQALSDFKKTRQDTWHVDVKVSSVFQCFLQFHTRFYANFFPCRRSSLSN
jgi:proteasome activator subunit 4